MHSARFGLPVVLTEHANLRMLERDMNAALVLEIIARPLRDSKVQRQH